MFKKWFLFYSDVGIWICLKEYVGSGVMSNILKMFLFIGIVIYGW